MIFKPELVEKILAGTKTETRRLVKAGETECRYKVSRDYAVQPGRTKPGVARILVIGVHRERLKRISEAGAQAEGFSGVPEFMAYWARLHGRADPEQETWVIRFELVEPTQRREGGASVIVLRAEGL